MSDDRLDRLDYYTLLRIDRSADDDAIRSAFRAFARKYHPDKFVGHPEDVLAQAARIYRRGAKAVRILTNPIARKTYEAALAKEARRIHEDEIKALSEPGDARKPSASQEDRDLPRTPNGRALYQRARELIRAGDAKEAWRALKSAQALEPENQAIRSKLEVVEKHLRGLK